MNSIQINRFFNLIRPYVAHPFRVYRNIKWRRASTISNKKHIFIVGCPRSGTTLLHRMLALNPALFSPGMESNLFSLREMFSRHWYGLPAKEQERLFAQSVDVVDFFDGVTDSLMYGLPNVFFVDKTPQYILKLPYLVHHFPFSSFINVVRDGRDCFLSSLCHPNVPQRISVNGFAQYWRRCILVGKKFLDYPRCFELKYERLCQDPESEISRLCAFLGVDYDQDMIKPELIAGDRRANISYFSKLKEPINSSSCERYKTEMNPSDLRRFLSIAKAELELCGYEIA